MDRQFTVWMNGFAGRNALLDWAMIAITRYGVPLIVIIVALHWWQRRDRSHVRHVVVRSGLAFLLGLAANQVILFFVHRIRPYDAGVTLLMVARSADWSFPSDHATASIAVVVAFTGQRLPGKLAVLATLATLICLSRVYVGLHYASDVLAGAAIGALAAGCVALVYREGSRLDKFVTGLL